MDDDLLVRWPHADDHRPLPMQSCLGSDDESTAALGDLMYLREIRRQADIFDASFCEAIDAALVRDDSDECWRHIQSALFAAIIVIRLLDPRDSREWGGHTRAETRKIGRRRARRLRKLLLIPSNYSQMLSVFDLRNLRDVMEHVDERLDHIADAPVGSLTDWYISSGTFFRRDPAVTSAAPLGLRAFDATAGVLFIDDKIVSMFAIDIDMLKISANAEEAITEAQELVKGRCVFGGTQMVELPRPDKRLDEMRTWERKRAEILQAEGDDVAK